MPMLDASGIIHFRDDQFLVAEDETDQIRLFTFTPSRQRFVASGKMLDFGRQESDFESLAWDPHKQRYFAIGSHSEDYSRRLLQFSLTPDARVSASENILYQADRLLHGEINIESMTVVDGRLLMGYRSPMLHEQAAAVLFEPGSGEQMLVGFDLQGRVFRDMVRIDSDNYLILAGPRKGSDYKKLPARIFWWNGDFFHRQLCDTGVDLVGWRAEGIACQLRAGGLDVLIGSDESKVRDASGFRMGHVRFESVDAICTVAPACIELEVHIDGS